jgi:hypothetical protein
MGRPWFFEAGQFFGELQVNSSWEAKTGKERLRIPTSSFSVWWS